MGFAMEGVKAVMAPQGNDEVREGTRTMARKLVPPDSNL
jgi:hypothetical protein